MSSRPATAVVASSSASPGERLDTHHLNLAVIVGRISRPVGIIVLPSGDRLATFDVSTPTGVGGRRESVPVCWPDPAARVDQLNSDDEVVVVGRVRRRFFRVSGGALQSRTEISAQSVAPLRRGRRRAFTAARAALDGAFDVGQSA